MGISQGQGAESGPEKVSDCLSEATYRRQLWVVLVLLILPFIVFYWMVPLVGKYTLGNDYQNFWINMQLYLRFSLEHGTFPLYAPGFNGGWTSSVLTLGQMYHPISWIAALTPGYWTGHAYEIGTLLRLVSLGVCNLVLYLFLRRLRLGTTMALVVSFITVYNLRMLDMFRYAASLENYVAFLVLCAALGWCFLTDRKKLSFVLIIVCTYLLVTGGHPQIAFFGLLGAAFFGLIAPYYLAVVLEDEVKLSGRLLLRYYFTIALAVLAGLALASWYSFPYYFEYMQEGGRASGWSFERACYYHDSLLGHISNFFNLYQSEVHGAFGGSSLIILAVFSPLLVLLRIRVPWVIWVVWLAGVVVYVTSLGANGPLYYYFWKYFPFARSFRVPGRLNVLLPFLFFLLLAWGSKAQGFTRRKGSSVWKPDPLAILAVIAFICFVPVCVLTARDIEPVLGRWTPARIHQNIPQTAKMIVLMAGAVSLLAFFVFRSFGRSRPVIALILIGAVVTQVACALRYGTWVVKAGHGGQTYEQMEKLQQEFMEYRAPPGLWLREMLEEHMKWSFMEPSLGRFATSYTCVGSPGEAYESLAVSRNIDHIYVEGFDQAQAREVTDVETEMSGRFVDLVYNSYNNLKFDTSTDQSCFFVFSYPYSSCWRAFVDGDRAQVYRCNGIEQCMWVPMGRHHIELRYWSRPAAVGTAITCIVGALVAIVCLTSVRPRALRYVSVVLASACFILLFIVWCRSLYGGGNIGTKFSWSSADTGPHLNSQYNLAYGKNTSMSLKSEAYNQHSSRGVDGSRHPYYGFTTGTQEHAWWIVDLGKVEHIGKIVLVKKGQDSAEMGYPFDVLTSSDAKRWRRLATITSRSQGDRWELETTDVTARYVCLQTRGAGYIALAEVEIYKADVIEPR